MTKGNEAAFPEPDFDQEGLTMREYFAAVSLQGLMANAHLSERYLGTDMRREYTDDMAELAEVVADKMINRLNNTSNGDE